MQVKVGNEGKMMLDEIFIRLVYMFALYTAIFPNSYYNVNPST